MTYKLNLLEAQDLTQDEFSSNVWKYIQSKDYSNAANVADVNELKKVIYKYFYDNFPNLRSLLDDDKFLSLLFMWYTSFRNLDIKSNPFLNLLSFLDKNQFVPTYDSLVSINNKYGDGILQDQDLVGDTKSPLFNDIGFWNANQTDQEYYIDVWAFLNDKRKEEELKQDLQDKGQIKFGSDNPRYQIIDPSRPSYRKLSNVVLFQNGAISDNPNKMSKASTIRTANEVESITASLSKLANTEKRREKARQDNTQVNKPKGSYNTSEENVRKFIIDNRLTKDLLQDLKTYLDTINL